MPKEKNLTHIEEDKMTGKWIGGKGSQRRPENTNKYEEAWEKIFGKPRPKIKSRKETPSHASTQMHKDKTKVIPRKRKYYDKLD